MKTNKWTKILVATGCCVFAMGAGFMNLTATAKAEDKTLGGVTVSSFAMDDGAWVRKDTTKETTGLRFVARMAKTSYDSLEALEANGASVDYGMLIVPADYSAELTEETVFGASASYCLEEKTATHTATCNKKHITQVLAEKLAIDGEEAVLRGALVNLKSQNVNREFVG
ncbi:MAG: hypothetical protein IJ938_02800, partial [Clostridia bacterium]|nr:hypothetical protein [Clostridia bacterium]